MIDIEKIISLNENSRLEAKKASGGIPDSLWESYSAFANTEGGVILLGVSEIDSKLVVTGAHDAHKKIKTIWDILNDCKKISNNILFEKHIYSQQANGNDVIVIEVPRADRHDKPVYINNDLFGGAYRRNAEGDYHCSPQEVKAMLRDQSDLPIDSKVINELSWQDLDYDSISRYRNRFASLKPAHVWNSLDNIEFLRKTGSVRKNKSGIFCPTLAGLLMFGTEDIITEILPDYFLDYREKYDDNRWSDRAVSNSGEWSGNIFDFFFKIIDRLTADVKRPFRMRNGIEREDDTAVNTGIREALANTLIHADYYGRQGIVIEKRKKEIHFSNPGGCRPDINEVMEGGVSDPRNPTIFKLFSLIEIGERAGSGIFNICTVWSQIKWKEPSLHEKFSPERTIFTLPVELENDHLIENDVENEDLNKKITENNQAGGQTGGQRGQTSGQTGGQTDQTSGQTGGQTDQTGGKTSGKTDQTGGKTGGKTDQTGGKTLSEIQTNLLNLIKEKPKISIKEISVRLKINTSAIQKHINKLKKDGIIQREGADFGGKWVVSDV